MPCGMKAFGRRMFSHRLVRICYAEFFGTMILMMFGTGSIAQSLLSHKESGQLITIYLGWGIGVTMAVCFSAPISGGHLNPAVTIALAAFQKFPKKDIAPYILSQVFGCFMGCAVVYGVYIDALIDFDGGIRTMETAGIFATYPRTFLSWNVGFMDQLVGTALLVGILFAFIDTRHPCSLPASAVPFAVGLLVTAIGCSFGFNDGYAINPARDFGARLFSWMVGYPNVWSAGASGGVAWWWIPIVAPTLGGLVGGFFHWVTTIAQTSEEEAAAETTSQRYGNLELE